MEDQLLEPKDVVEKTAKVRFSREGGLEELVRELSIGGKFVLTFPARLTLVENDLVFEFGMNVGVDPHPGLHFSVAFDLPVVVPKMPDPVDEDLTPTPSKRKELEKAILDSGGKLEDFGFDKLTEDQVVGILEGMRGT